MTENRHPMYLESDYDECPNCDHSLSEDHDFEEGCLVGTGLWADPELACGCANEGSYGSDFERGSGAFWTDEEFE